jgi:hypothetical protein
MMIISIVGLVLLIIAVYFLIRTKPNLFLLDYMNEVFGNGKENRHGHTPPDGDTCSRNTQLSD